MYRCGCVLRSRWLSSAFRILRFCVRILLKSMKPFTHLLRIASDQHTMQTNKAFPVDQVWIQQDNGKAAWFEPCIGGSFDMQLLEYIS